MLPDYQQTMYKGENLIVFNISPIKPYDTCIGSPQNRRGNCTKCVCRTLGFDGKLKRIIFLVLPTFTLAPHIWYAAIAFSCCPFIGTQPDKTHFLARLHEVQKSYCSHHGRIRSRSRSTLLKFSRSLYLGNNSSESIHTWTIGTQ